jgi:hypothetical protein
MEGSRAESMGCGSGRFERVVENCGNPGMIESFSMHQSPSGDTRRKAAQKLRSHLRRADKRTSNMNEKQNEAALQEALRHARPGYRERE